LLAPTRAALGFEEAVERAAVYLEAGADVTFVEAPQSEEEIAAIPQRLPGPQVINMVQAGRTPLLALVELEGYAMALYANAALQELSTACITCSAPARARVYCGDA
jgi:2-methylisocitrate lyase-like PEP mutase family enzyme